MGLVLCNVRPRVVGRDVSRGPTKALAMQRLPRLVTVLLIVALCALVAFWITRAVRGTPIPVPPVAPSVVADGGGRVDAVLASARLFGSRRPGVLSDNVRPLGMIADGSGRGSVIVSVDGQPAKVYRVGDTLDGRLVSAIRPGEIELESGGARQVFRLPPPPPASAGSVTVVGTGTALAAADEPAAAVRAAVRRGAGPGAAGARAARGAGSRTERDAAGPRRTAAGQRVTRHAPTDHAIRTRFD